MRVWKTRVTFQIPFQYFDMNCVSQGSPISWFPVVRAGLWSDGLAAAFRYRLILKISLKDAAQTDSSCGFVLLSGSVTWFYMLFMLCCNNGENSAFSSVLGCHKWHHQSQPCAEAPHAARGAVLLSKCSSKKKPRLVWPWSVEIQELSPVLTLNGQGQALSLHCLFFIESLRLGKTFKIIRCNLYSNTSIYFIHLY